MLDRQHLVILREVARAGGVAAAAERLNLSQSAVSHAIAKLEAYHGVRIWRPQGRSTKPRIASPMCRPACRRAMIASMSPD